MKNQWRILILILSAVASAAALAATQGIALRGNPWWQADVYWPNFLVLVLPMLLGFGLIELCLRLFLPGEGGGFARLCTWLALGLRLAFLILAPVAMILWGYESNKNYKGLVQKDAINAVDTAWKQSQLNNPVFEAFRPGPGDNTGGITTMGTAIFRLLSPDMERTLLLGLVASIFTSLTVIAVFRLGNGLFSPGVAKTAALIAAVYPEGVLIGSSHQQMGYITLIFSVALLAVAGILRNPPGDAEGPGLPKRRDAAILLVIMAVLGVLVSQPFTELGLVCIAGFVLWSIHPKPQIGRILWIGLGVIAAVLVFIRVLGIFDVVSSDSDPLFLVYRYIYGMAYAEYDKLIQAGGGDLFQNVLSTMSKGPAFILSAVYGLVRPALPAAIGYRNTNAQGGFFWQLLNLFRSLGWYAVLPVLLYGTLKSLRGFLSRKPETIFMLIFWAIALVGSYRAFGDEWDNPRYRLFALAPMAILAGWAWISQRKEKDPWFARIVITFAAATVSLTVWYILRDYALLNFPAVPSILVMGAITLVAFGLSWFLIRPKQAAAAG
jgi:hypothetical protein